MKKQKILEFKYKTGERVYHKSDPDCQYPFVILTRKIVEGVSGGRGIWYDCVSIILGWKMFAEIELL